ncbi:hypothetical protein NTH_03174 [Nitratireductor thuwali]|uniref:VOC domain-containing protein n=2 Tax=Nitratireductor thuwali TaxID=2267699 RepID=A0ABY5ML52_9HYPH|nr:hypothetical protein NTH_03174 [Nitratireductor thuwali]
MAGQTPPPVPEGYHSVNPWIIPKGASGLIKFLEHVFSAVETKEARIPDRDGLLIHSEVRIGDSVIMIFDSKEDWPQTPSFLQVYVEDAESVLTRARNAGAEVVTELSDFMFGEKIARFFDPWGNLWWVHQRAEEVDQAAESARVEQEMESFDSEATDYVYDTLMRAMRDLRSRSR